MSLEGRAIGNVVAREQQLAHGDLYIAAFGDGQRVLAGAGPARERPLHLFGSLQIELVGVEFESLWVRHDRTRVDAQQHVVPDRIVLVGVVRVVGRDPLDAHLGADLHQLVVQRRLHVDAVVLELEIETVAEHLAVLRRLPARQREVPRHDRLGDLRRQTTREADQPLRVLGEQLMVGAGPVVEAFEPRPRRDLHEVVVAAVVGRQQRQVEGVGPVLLLRRFLSAVTTEEVALHPQDRLDRVLAVLAVLAGGPVEVQDAVHHAVVGDGTGRHPRGLGGLEHLAHPARPVKHRVLAVGM